MDNKQILFDRITSGFSVVENSDSFYVIYDPRSKDRQIGEIHYENRLNQLVNSGIPSVLKLNAILQEQKLWTDQDEFTILQLDKKIEKLQDEALECTFKAKKRRQLLSQIEACRLDKRLLVKRKNGLYNNSAEYIALLHKNRFFLYNNTYDLNGKKLWDDWNKFNQEVDNKFVHHLLNQSYFIEYATEENIRELARSEPWRSVWMTANKVGNLFDSPIADITELQRILLSWTLLYDNVYEHPDRPDYEVIENNDLLDAWFRKERRKRSQENKVSNQDKYKGQEVGIVVESYEDAEKVFSMNSSVMNNRLEKRDEAIEKAGEIKQQNLPDQKLKRQMLRNELVNKNIKERNS